MRTKDEKKILIRNGNIWTADKSQPWADSIVISGDTIDFVGREEDAAKACGEDIVTVDAQGKMVIPAFMDSHVHVVSIAQTMWCLLLEQKEYSSVEEIMEIVKAYAEEHPKEEVPYIYAYSCPTELMEADNIDRNLMDRYVTDRPVLLCDANYHRCLVNSLMLELMEIDENTPFDPETSCNYLRFEGTNIPNGVIEERAHEFHHDIDKMFEKLDWYPPTEDDPEVMGPVLDAMTDMGICGIHDGFTESEKTMTGLKALHEQGRLNQYYNIQPLMSSVDDLEETIATAKDWAARYNNDYMYVEGIKYFLDGTNELATGAVLEPFITDPDDYGIMNCTEDELTHVFERLNQEGLNIQIHVVGDRAFRTALNGVERAQKSEKAAGRDFTIRVTLLHCELTHPDDRKRPAELGVLINFTPVWAGGLFGDASKQYLGEERYNSMYAFNEMIRSGAIVNFSSDMVDEEGLQWMPPLLGIEVGHTRIQESLHCGMREAASERMSREDLLRGYTLYNAIEMGLEDRAGSLEAGKKANICILSDNLFEVPANRIKDIDVETVIFEGKVVKGELK